VNKPRGGIETATLGLVSGLMALGSLELHLVTLEKRRTQQVVESSPEATKTLDLYQRLIAAQA
jgi:hypothetical protein